MSHSSTNFLRLVIVGIGAVVAVICLLILPRVIMAELDGDFDFLPLIAGLYLPAVPFFYALIQGFKLLRLIDRSEAFSEASVQAFRRIKFCGLAISGIFVLGLPYIFHLAQIDDAPGLVAMALLITLLSFVVATFSAVMQRLFQSAVDLKQENDLTV